MSDKCFECESELTKTCLSCNTRAAPDVPELVRYRLNSLGELVYSENGQYVLHSQAAEIIAAKDAEIDRLKEALSEIANAYTAHGYSDAMDAVHNLKDVAKDAINGD